MSARKATVAAAANIAFVKYWGSRDVERGIPLNPSISMTLSRCQSICTAEYHRDDGPDRNVAAPPGRPGDAEPAPRSGRRGDEVFLAAEDGSLAPAPRSFAEPVLAQLERIRRWTTSGGRFRVATRNTFPMAAGLASSASGFAALSLAAARAAGRDPSPAELSDLARRSGSGSAARSAFGGYVEWPAAPWEGGPGRSAGVGEDGSGTPSPEGSGIPAGPLAPPEHWDLRDVIAIVEASRKPVSSREGHRRVLTSPYFETRLGLLAGRLEEARAAIRERDFERLVPVLEEEAVDLHFLAMSARPPIHYWTPGTVEVLEVVRGLRVDGVPCASTVDAGPNVHVICPSGAEPSVVERLERLEVVGALIRDGVGPGPRTDVDPLF